MSCGTGCGKAGSEAECKNFTLNVGQQKKLKVKNTKKKVSWKSSNKSIATVSKKGVVKGKSAGTAKITAKVSGRKLVCKVKVKAKAKKGANANAHSILFATADGGDFVAGMTSINISFQLDAKSTNVKAQILDVTDRVLYTKTFSSCKPNTVKSFAWNGKNNAGEYVGDTTCKVQIVAGKTKTVSNQYFRVLTASSTGFAGGNGSAVNPYQVASLEQLRKVGTSSTRCFVQTADIDANLETLEAMGGTDVPFEGSYDGSNHVISNLVIKDGLFVAVGEKGVVSNLSFQGCTATKSKSINVGMIASTNKGKIQNCVFQGCTANTSGNYSSVGILCGEQCETGNIVNCSIQNVEVSAASKSRDDSYIGGISGFNSGKIISSTVKHIVATAKNGQDRYCGGITGYNQTTGIVSNCEVTDGKIQLDSTNNFYNYAGGITGYNKGQILTCIFTGTAVGYHQGSIAGINDGIIVNQ